MSDQTEPVRPSDRPAAPPSGWTPAPLTGDRPTLARQPSPTTAGPAPLGQPDAPSTGIEEFAPRRSWWPLVVTLVAVLAAGLIAASTLLRPTLPSPTKPSPSAESSATAPGLPFVSPDERYSGHWELLKHQWTDSGVELEVRISVDHGPLHYSFIGFENSGVSATDPQPSSHLPRMSGLQIDTGQEETGWIFMPLERGQSTLILANAGGQQISALPIPG